MWEELLGGLNSDFSAKLQNSNLKNKCMYICFCTCVCLSVCGCVCVCSTCYSSPAAPLTNLSVWSTLLRSFRLCILLLKERSPKLCIYTQQRCYHFILSANLWSLDFMSDKGTIFQKMISLDNGLRLWLERAILPMLEKCLTIVLALVLSLAKLSTVHGPSQQRVVTMQDLWAELRVLFQKQWSWLFWHCSID